MLELLSAILDALVYVGDCLRFWRFFLTVGIAAGLLLWIEGRIQDESVFERLAGAVALTAVVGGLTWEFVARFEKRPR